MLDFSPIEQFEIHNIGGAISFLGWDISFSNSALIMLITAVIIMLFFVVSLHKVQIIPSKIQVLAEASYVFIMDMSKEHIGDKAAVFFPFIYAVFMFFLFGNVLGAFPYTFAFTSHLVVTVGFSILIFILATLYGIYLHKFKFITLFLPKGTPVWLLPLMFIIEIISYLAKALSMGIRMFANIMAGHIMLEIFAAFIIMLGFWGFIPFSFTIILFAFEIAIACLQAYIFALLTCLYFEQVVNLH